MNERDYFDILIHTAALKGKAVLEIGGSIPFELIEHTEVSRWLSTDITLRRLDERDAARTLHWYDLIINDASTMAFKDSSFDLVFSINTFEHVFDLGPCMDNIYRILKPGGLFFSKFTPIWSSPKGHHTWVWHDGKAVTFNQEIMPDWSHLVCDEGQLLKILEKRHDRELSKKITEYVFHSKDLNRLMDKDFETILFRNPFRKIFFYRIKSKQRPESNILQRISERYPNIGDPTTMGYFFLLSKGSLSIMTVLRAFVGILYGLGKYATGRHLESACP